MSIVQTNSKKIDMSFFTKSYSLKEVPFWIEFIFNKQIGWMSECHKERVHYKEMVSEIWSSNIARIGKLGKIDTTHKQKESMISDRIKKSLKEMSALGLITEHTQNNRRSGNYYMKDELLSLGWIMKKKIESSQYFTNLKMYWSDLPVPLNLVEKKENTPPPIVKSEPTKSIFEQVVQLRSDVDGIMSILTDENIKIIKNRQGDKKEEIRKSIQKQFDEMLDQAFTFTS